MTTDQLHILQTTAKAGTVPPNTFKGKGVVVATLVRRGWLKWGRGQNHGATAIGLSITEEGRKQVQL